jgi:hypothetical protein
MARPRVGFFKMRSAPISGPAELVPVHTTFGQAWAAQKAFCRSEGLYPFGSTPILCPGYGAFEGVRLFHLRQRARLGRQIVGIPVYPTGNPIGRFEAVLPESPIADR